MSPPDRLDHRRELRALRDHHADAFDDDVDDLVLTVFTTYAPLDPNCRSFARNDFSTDQNVSIALAAGGADGQRLALILTEPGCIGCNDACLSGLHPHPLGLEWAQTGYRGARQGCSRPRRSPIPAFATRVPATFPR